MALISIVVPVYNVGDFIEETVQSVMAQTVEDWELILVDDGSTDNSREVIEQLQKKDDRIHYFHKKNGGQASARNYGIRQSKGTYISLLDADDLWTTDKLEVQLQELKDYNPDFLYGLGYFYYPEREEKLVPYDWVSGQMTGKKFFQVLYHSCAVNTNTVFVKRSLFEQVGYFDEDELLRGTEDWDLWLKIAKNVDNVYGSPTRNVYYRIHEGGIHLQRARMLIGKSIIYAKYDNDPEVQRLVRKREYRYIYRELFNALLKEDRSTEIRQHFDIFFQKDKWGWGTFSQAVLIRMLKPKSFIKISNSVIYRIAFRLEKLSYWLFLK